MYTMTMRNPGANGYDGEPVLKLYDPTLTEYGLEAPEMQLEANMIGGLTFTIYDWNPRFNDLQLRKTAIYLYRDGMLRMVFRPIKRRLTFHGGVEYTCEEMTGLLNDFMAKWAKREGTTAKEIIRDVIYNTQNGWATEASKTTIVIAEKAAVKGLLNKSETEFAVLKPDNVGWGSQGKAVKDLNMSLYLLGYLEAKYMNYSIYNIQTAVALTHFMEDSLGEPGMTITQSQIEASKGPTAQWDHPITGYLFSAANDKTNRHGAYYDLLTLIKQKIANMDDGTEYQYTSSYAASFVFDPDVDAPASDIIEAENGLIDVEESDFAGYWDYLQETLVDEYAGFLIPVWETETRCRLRYVTDADLPVSSQVIRFGENMSDLFLERDTTDVYTTIIPVKEDGTMWDISQQGDQNGQKFVVLEALFKAYGRKDTTKIFEGATPAIVYPKIMDWIRTKTPTFKPFIQARAYDLKYAGVNVEYLTWMEQIQVISDKHDVLEAYPIRAATVSLDSPSANEYELGEEPPSIADQINDEVKTLDQRSRRADEAISKNTTEINTLDLRVSALEGN